MFCALLCHHKYVDLVISKYICINTTYLVPTYISEKLGHIFIPLLPHFRTMSLHLLIFFALFCFHPNPQLQGILNLSTNFIFHCSKFKKKLLVLSLFFVPHDLFWTDLPKSLTKISQRPENRKDWSK